MTNLTIPYCLLNLNTFSIQPPPTPSFASLPGADREGAFFSLGKCGNKLIFLNLMERIS